MSSSASKMCFCHDVIFTGFVFISVLFQKISLLVLFNKKSHLRGDPNIPDYFKRIVYLQTIDTLE